MTISKTNKNDPHTPKYTRIATAKTIQNMTPEQFKEFLVAYNKAGVQECPTSFLSFVIINKVRYDVDLVQQFINITNGKNRKTFI